jgi:hypothetical protein
VKRGGRRSEEIIDKSEERRKDSKLRVATQQKKPWLSQGLMILNRQP